MCSHTLGTSGWEAWLSMPQALPSEKNCSTPKIVLHGAPAPSGFTWPELGGCIGPSLGREASVHAWLLTVDSSITPQTLSHSRIGCEPLCAIRVGHDGHCVARYLVIVLLLAPGPCLRGPSIMTQLLGLAGPSRMTIIQRSAFFCHRAQPRTPLLTYRKVQYVQHGRRTYCKIHTASITRRAWFSFARLHTSHRVP